MLWSHILEWEEKKIYTRINSFSDVKSPLPPHWREWAKLFGSCQRRTEKNTHHGNFDSGIWVFAWNVSLGLYATKMLIYSMWNVMMWFMDGKIIGHYKRNLIPQLLCFTFVSKLERHIIRKKKTLVFSIWSERKVSTNRAQIYGAKLAVVFVQDDMRPLPNAFNCHLFTHGDPFAANSERPETLAIMCNPMRGGELMSNQEEINFATLHRGGRMIQTRFTVLYWFVFFFSPLIIDFLVW